MEPLRRDQPIKTSESVRETINQDGAVLLDIKQGLCFSMNPVGARIWAMLKAGRTVDQIASGLALEFDVPLAQIEADLTEFLDNLKIRNLVIFGCKFNSERKSWLSRFLSLAGNSGLLFTLLSALHSSRPPAYMHRFSK